jgi:hypothetical protein
MMKTVTRLASLFAAVSVLTVSQGCSMHEQQKSMTAPESKTENDVFKTAEAVLRERFYQVRVHPESNHIIALSTIGFDGNQLSRDKVEIYVFLENGFWMPKVWVQKFYDFSEPEMGPGGPIVGRFPIEAGRYPAPADDWRPIIFDRVKEQEIRNAILDRLKLPYNSDKVPSEKAAG